MFPRIVVLFGSAATISGVHEVDPEPDRNFDSAGYVRWDDGSTAARLGNRVYLDCECDGNPHFPECVGEGDCLRSTPTVPVDDDCRLPLFIGRQNPITVGVEHTNDLMKCLPSMMVPKHYSFDARVAIAKVGGELHLRVLRIVMEDKASNKPNNDHLPIGGSRLMWKDLELPPLEIER